MDEQSLWGDALPPAITPEKRKPTNPCLATYGAGPAQATCNGCALLHMCNYHGKTYWKCGMRTATHGNATDHKRAWPACGQFVRLDGGRRIEFYA